MNAQAEEVEWMVRGRKASRKLPRVVQQALAEQQEDAHSAESLPPLQTRTPILAKPPHVQRPPLLLPEPQQKPSALLPASTSGQRTDELLGLMGQQVLMGPQVQGAFEFWIELKQEILGGLQIRISLAKGRISATLLVHSAETEQQILEKLPILQQQLRLRGMSVEKIEVCRQP
jgi:hypothetical protein